MASFSETTAQQKSTNNMDIELNATFSSGVMRFLVKVLQIDNGIMVNTKTIEYHSFHNGQTD